MFSANNETSTEDLDKTCTWKDLFDDESRNTLKEGFAFTGIIAVLLGSWLNATLFSTNLRFDRSYRNLANFTMTVCIRRVVAGFLSLEYFKTWSIGEFTTCRFIAFLETFLAVFEIECLTHVCIERYVVAKYVTNGWMIQKGHYTLYLCLCFLFACLYSLPPFFGFGRYAYDFSCSSCTFDMVPPKTWQKYFTVTIFLLRSVKPTIFMIIMLFRCRTLEKKYINSTENRRQSDFTKSVIILTSVNLICWTPIALIRAWVVFSYLYGGLVVTPPGFYIQWAMWVQWVAPAPSSIALFVIDERVRSKMFKICSTDDCDDNIKKD